MLSALLQQLRQQHSEIDRGDRARNKHGDKHDSDSVTMDDEELVIDSPEQEAVEDEDLEDVDDNLKLGQSATGAGSSKPPKDKDANRDQYLTYPESLPYECETLAEMDAQLDVIVQRISQAVQARDYDVGLLQWNHRLECWISLKYPMKRAVRAKLARLFYELSVLPGMDPRIIETAANMCMTLLANKKRIDIDDLQLPWEPLYKVLEQELFPKKRKTGITGISVTLLTLTEYAQRFFPPHEIPNMLSTFLPRLDGSSLNSILVTQSFMAHFLPLSHPHEWLDPAFVLWEAFSNSQIYTEQWLDVMSRLAEKHVDPAVSDPKLIGKLRKASKRHDVHARADGASITVDESSTDDGSSTEEPSNADGDKWKGIRRDIGIFTTEQWEFLMQKLLRAMGIPMGNVRKSSQRFISQGGETGAANADAAANATVMKMKKPSEKLHSLAILLIYSMSEDSPILDRTPAASKQPSRVPSMTDLRAATNGANGYAADKKAYIGGSKSLDSLLKFVNATETFFHPSNYGGWTIALTRFLQNITWEFTKRWIEEEKADCKTPKEWRLTPRIRREFVLVTRQVAFLAMFSKDPGSMGCAQSALKSMSFLEPNLVIPAVLERSFPALQGLLETHRTTACMGTLAAVANPFISRTNYPAGAKNLVPLLDLFIPGLDVNDPLKTLSSVAFFIQSLSTVRIADLTRAEAIDEGASAMQLDGVHESLPSIEVDDASESSEPVLSRAEEDDLTRQSTADFPEWIAKYFKAVLALYDNLPEPGRSGRSGGKLEEAMIGTVTVSCDFILGQSSPEIYDIALNIFKEHVVRSPKANSARAIGHLAACFGRADPAKALKAFLSICIDKIKIELEHGASSTRTTSSSFPLESDTAFHWYCLLILGTLHMASFDAAPYKQELLDFFCLMRDKCYSERGYTYNSRMVQALLASLTSIWPRDGRSANPDDWQSEEYQKRPHQHWGQLYTATEVKIDWHTPSDDEIALALKVIEVVVEPAVEALEKLAEPSQPVNKEWRNDFNRYNSLVRSALTGVSSLTTVETPAELGADLSDVGDEDLDFIRHFPRCKYGAALSDPNDPRLQKLVRLKERAQDMLHKAIERLTTIDDKSEDAIDSIKMAISTSKNIMTCHPMDRNSYVSVKSNFTFARDLSKYTVNQKKFPRLVWVRRASLYHASRLRLNTFYRRRSKLDDLIIKQLAEMTMSKYVSVRRAAQRALDSLVQLYDGTRTMLLDKYFAALAPGNDPDRMKGALYVLGSKAFGNMAILDWSIGPTYIMKLLDCQHEQKPSVQQLVKSVTSDFLMRLAEPSTIKLNLTSESARILASELENMSGLDSDTALVDRLADHNQRRINSRNDAYAKLVPDLLAVAQDKSRHWRYVLTATRFLRALVRRDQPLPAELCSYLAGQVVSELPNQRSVAIVSLTKILHFVKLRTFAPNPEDLLLQRSHNPLKRKIAVPDDIDETYTSSFLKRFKETLESDSILVDKHNTGWLVWGKTYNGYAVPSEEPIEWDATSHEAVQAIREQVTSKAFWEAMFKNLHQEHARDYLALDNVTVIKSIFQIYMDEPLDVMLPMLEEVMTDNDRHKQRAAAEVIGGLLRAVKHWPLSKQRRVHEWLSERWQKIFDSINLDTQPAWEMLVEYVLGNRDPRRNESLMSFLTGLSLDVDSSEAFKQARKGYLLGSTMKSLSWHFEPWIDQFSDPSWQAITSPYTEVRLAVSDNLRSLSEMRLHPSFSSTQAFLAACQSNEGMRLLSHVDDDYERRIDVLVSSLEGYRAMRKPFAKDAVQPYDAACLTILTWLWGGMNDYRITTIYPFVVRLLPELMHMQDIQDNLELQKWAQVVLAAMAALSYPSHLVSPVLKTLLGLFESPSWRTRLAILPLLQVFFFHQLFSLSEDQIREVVETLRKLLSDNHIEVREAAATTLSGIVRCSQRDSVLSYKETSMRDLKKATLPTKKDVAPEVFQEKLLTAHSAVLSASALILAWPYDVPGWLPDLLVATITKFSSSRAPVSTTVKDLLAQFRKTHQDTWADDQKKFTSEQLQDLMDFSVGTSYYA